VEKPVSDLKPALSRAARVDSVAVSLTESGRSVTGSPACGDTRLARRLSPPVIGQFVARERCWRP